MREGGRVILTLLKKKGFHVYTLIHIFCLVFFHECPQSREVIVCDILLKKQHFKASSLSLHVIPQLAFQFQYSYNFLI